MHNKCVRNASFGATEQAISAHICAHDANGLRMGKKLFGFVKYLKRQSIFRQVQETKIM